jgi:hypothetical protein
MVTFPISMLSATALEHSRNLEMPGARRRRIGHCVLVRQRFARLVLAQSAVLRAREQHLGHGFHRVRVQLPQPVHVSEDFIQLAGHAVQFFAGQFKMRQRRHMADFLFSDLHDARAFRFDRR